MYRQCFPGTYELHKSRLLRRLHQWGIVLIAMPEHKETDLSAQEQRVRWFGAAQPSATISYLEIGDDILRNEIDTARRQRALVWLSDILVDQLVLKHRTNVSGHLRAQLYSCIAAGEDARNFAIGQGWNWPYLFGRLSLV